MTPSGTSESTEAKFPCDQCEFEAPTRKSFDNHKRKHREKTFQCSQCDFKAVFKSELKRHSRNHTGIKPFICPSEGCTYSAVRRGDITKHLLVHSEEKPYSCSFCKETFRYYTELQNHVRNHTGKKPLRCRFQGCNFSCSLPVEMRRHACTHTGEKPVKCYFENCKFACITERQLKAHIYTHTGEKHLKCEFKGCEYATANSDSLKKHIRTHTGEKPYRCVWIDCGYSCKSACNFRRHSLKHLIRKSSDLTEVPSRNADSQMPRKNKTAPIIVEPHFEGPDCGERTTVTLDNPIKRYFCQVCDFRTKKQKKYKSHLQSHVDNELLYCSLCDFICSKKKIMKLHSKAHKVDAANENISSMDLPIPSVHFKSKAHSVNTSKIKILTTNSSFNVSNVDERAPPVKRIKRRLYQCKLCDFGTKKRSKYKVHLEWHRVHGSLFCIRCDFICSRTKTLQVHFQTHDNIFNT